MKKIITLLILMPLLFSAQAQSIQSFSGSLLWKISGNGLSSPSYILGTHHLTPGSFADSIPGLDTALKETRLTAGELILSDMSSLQENMINESKMPKNESYEQLLSPEDYGKLNECLKNSFGAGLEGFSQFKPAMISVMYSFMLYTRVHPEIVRPEHEGLDSYLQRIGLENNIPVIGLETAEDQLNTLFNSLSLKKQAEDLMCTISLPVELALEGLNLLNKYYREGNLTEMYQLSFHSPDDPCPPSPESIDNMLKNRNDKWLEKLPGIMLENPSLIVVGALHLAGEEGLLYQLNQRGYKVEAVKE